MTTPKPPRTILVVDDNTTVTRALATILTKEGYKPATYNNALSALDHARQNPPDAAVIDIHLPDLNGLVLSQRLRDTLGPDVPIIVVSGDHSMENLNALPHVGATYFLPKPMNTNHLLETIAHLLGPARVA